MSDEADDLCLDVFGVVVGCLFFAIVGYMYGTWNERERWCDWRDDLQLPMDVFYVDGVYRPEPWE